MGNKIANNFQKWRYDAGVYFHVTNDKKWPDGLEYQISYDDVHQINYTGDVWYNKKFNVRNITDGDYHYLPESFPNWTEYNKMIGLGGWGNRPKDNTPGTVGKHGKRVPVEINVSDSLHPIMKGLPHKWIHYNDGLYGDLRGPAENINVLAWAHSDKSSGGTGKDEPVIFTIKYGEDVFFIMFSGTRQMILLKHLTIKIFL